MLGPLVALDLPSHDRVQRKVVVPKASIANKLARGTHPTAFFLAALVAIGCESVTLEDI
jgi:hypothetical protein